MAALSRDSEDVAELLAMGVNSNSRDDETELTALHIAAQQNDIQTGEILLQLVTSLCVNALLDSFH